MGCTLPHLNLSFDINSPPPREDWQANTVVLKGGSAYISSLLVISCSKPVSRFYGKKRRVGVGGRRGRLGLGERGKLGVEDERERLGLG